MADERSAIAKISLKFGSGKTPFEEKQTAIRFAVAKLDRVEPACGTVAISAYSGE